MNQPDIGAMGRAPRPSFSLLASLLFAGCTASPPLADLILKNGVVHTLDPGNPSAEAVACRDGEIVCAASNAACLKFTGPATEVIDLEGRVVVPGFADSHAHLAGIGFREMTLNLEGVASLNELLERVREEASSRAPGEWIVGRGWIESEWEPPDFPTRYDLDRAAPGHPVYLVRADGHAGVANSAALAIAGIGRSATAPAGGEIMKDRVTGEPAGMLLDRAQSLVQRHLPRETPERIRQALVVGAERSARMGWTQISIAGNSWEEIELLSELVFEGKIPVRIYDAVRGPGPDADRLLELGPQTADPRLVIRGIKTVADGALGSRGAALLEPYSDHDSSGLLLHEREDLLPLFEAALRKGIQIQTHAIGDRANRFVLDLYEEAFERVPPQDRAVPEPRWRIEHAQILDPADLPRFARLGVIPSMQASHAITDLHFAKRRLGDGRLEGAYAWRALVDSGAAIAGGSDAPVEQGDPMVEFYAAAVRKSLDGSFDAHWRREQRLTRTEALKTLTIWAARAAFQEDERGTIEVGKWADLTVLSGDPMTVPDGELLTLRCEMTVVGGQPVFRAPALTADSP